MKSVAIYCRVSTEDKAREGYSIDSQKERLEAFCVSQGWRVQDTYIDDGFSGKDFDRPAITRLIADIAKNEFDVVLIYRLDRLSRRALDLLHLVEEVFEPNGVALKSATEPFDTSTISGRMMLTLLVAFAQFERESIAERVKVNMLHKASKGEWCGAFMSPFGYRNVDKQLVIDEQEAAIVRGIFEQRLEGHGYSAISIDLNNRQITTRQGKQWSRESIRKLLRNPVYAGYMAWNRTSRKKTKVIKHPKEQWILVEGNHEAIISQETWRKVQQLNDVRGLGSRHRNPDRIYPLSGLVYCGNCGNKYYGWYKKPYKQKTEKLYYTCGSRWRGNKKCGAPYIQTKHLEDIVLDFLEQLQHPEHSYWQAVQDKLSGGSDRRDELETAIGAIEQKLGRLKMAKARIFEGYEAGAIELPDFRMRIEQIKEDGREMNKHLEMLRAELAGLETRHIFVAQIVEQIKNVRQRWNNADENDRALLARSIIARITVYSRQDIRIELLD